MKDSLVLLFIFISSFGYTQIQQYNIESKKGNIGSLVVTKSHQDEEVTIKVESNIEIRLIVNIELKYILISSFVNNELLHSIVTTYVNGREHSSTEITRRKGYYLVKSHGKLSKYFHEINFTNALMYFYEPINEVTMFSEFDAISKPIKSIGFGKYQIENPQNGFLSEYIYKDGRLFKAINNTSLLTYTLVRV